MSRPVSWTSPADWSRLDAPLEFPPALLERLGWLVGSPCVSYCELDRRNERVVLDGAMEQWRRESPRRRRRRRRLLAAAAPHPLCSYREREDIWSVAYTVSDFATRCEFERTEIWNELYRDARNQLLARHRLTAAPRLHHLFHLCEPSSEPSRGEA